MKLLKKSKKEIIPSAKGITTIQNMEKLYMDIKKAEIMLDEMKAELLKQMKDNEIEKLSCNNVEFSIRKAYSRKNKKVDYEGLMKAGLYDDFVKESTTLIGESLVMKVKE